jgi:glycosyltransferase involved in cell wall biosynthesis
MDKNNNPLVTVGIPVFNGEKFIERRLESILNQTYKNFEIIISDNASTDDTSKICQNIINKKENIDYYLQEKNIGFVDNFNYLIKNASGKYCVVAAVDDLWEPTFLEKNVKILEVNQNIIGSTGEVKQFGNSGNSPKTSKIILKLKKIIRKQNVDITQKHVMNSKGDYNKKVDEYLRFNQGSFVYGLFRTNLVQKNIITGPLAAWDLVFILNILKFGDLHVIDEILLHKFSGGLSSKGIIDEYRRGEINFVDMFFPISFYNWCKKNIGLKFLVKNLDWFFFLGIFSTIQVIRQMKNIKKLS